MITVNVEKFLNDYEAAVANKREIEIEKENAIRTEIEKFNAAVANCGFSAHIREGVIAEITAEQEAQFNVAELDEKIARFENYLVEEKEDADVSEIEDVEDSSEIVIDTIENETV